MFGEGCVLAYELVCGTFCMCVCMRARALFREGYMPAYSDMSKSSMRLRACDSMYVCVCVEFLEKAAH
jgi:hypothetical protein